MRAGRKVASACPCEAITSRGFPRRFRLTDKHEYDRILKSRAALQIRCGCFRVLAMQSEREDARLGLIIGKRQLKRAVDRNHVKRMVRESFRITRMSLPAVDIVVQLVRTPDEGLDRDVAAIWERLGNDSESHDVA
jgi:ribonuclease P protein component